jgi:hypothetical protein
MTTVDPSAPPLPEQAEVDDTIKLITDNADRIFSWKYDRERPQLVTLYNKAMASQWDSMNDLDWATDVDPEFLVATTQKDNPTVAVARAAKDVPGSPFKNWGEKEFTQLSIESLKASLSQFMHGEQGAMMVAAKIVETVPWIDAKYYAATQTMDEARHTEVFAKYLDLKLGDAYPMSPYLDEQIQALIEDSRWDIAYLGMQIIIESLALAAFGQMLRATEEPLLRKLLRYVLADEARHVAFGILSARPSCSNARSSWRKTPSAIGPGPASPRYGTAWACPSKLRCPRSKKERQKSTSLSSPRSSTASLASLCPTRASSASSMPTTATFARCGAKPD